MAGELRVAVIDDDYFKREGMADLLDKSPHIAVVHCLDQDEALQRPLSWWDEIDIAIVDVFDEQSPGEVGTDMYSGIPALERLKKLDVRTLAITPHREHPLIQLRIHQANVDWVYQRHEVNDLDRLVDTLRYPDASHRPSRPSDNQLGPYGASRARVNDAVQVYQQSEYHPELTEESDCETLSTTYRKLDRFRTRIASTGFRGTEHRLRLQAVPRWPDTRDYVLRLIGRWSRPDKGS